MRCVIVIPARMGSTRFPGKPLVDLMGKPMVQWVVEAAVKAEVADRVLVATPDQEIVDACRRFGAEAVLTRPDHASGTDRIAEVAGKLTADVYVNVQGDEPLMPVETVQACAWALLDDPEAQLSSVYGECPAEEEDDPNVVKVVTDDAGYALYFSRYAIPYPRNPRPTGLKKHIGIYGYRRDPLLAFSQWPVGKLETAESLEQLRFLEKGYRMKMAFGKATPLAVDTPDQADRVRQILAGS